MIGCTTNKNAYGLFSRKGQINKKDKIIEIS